MMNENYSYGIIRKIGKTSNKIRVGKFCSIGNNVQAIMTGHNIDHATTFPFYYFFPEITPTGCQKNYGDILIGNDVYIGNDVTIIGGIKVGHGSVIGAGSVIASDVDPYSVVVGNPGKMVKKRFNKSQIESLLNIAWWDWEIKKIKENIPLLCHRNIDNFIEKHRRI